MGNYLWASLIVAGAAFVVLMAVVVSGYGPMTSLRRSLGRFEEVTEEIDHLRRNIDVLEHRANALRNEDVDRTQPT